MPAAAVASRPYPKEKSQQNKPPAEHKILFQNYVKSVGPRTYVSQVKEATNGNHYLVLTEAKRDEKTGEVKKIRLFIYSEDFPKFFQMIKSTAEFIKSHPVPAEVKQRREKFWSRQPANKSSSENPVKNAGVRIAGARMELASSSRGRNAT